MNSYYMFLKEKNNTKVIDNIFFVKIGFDIKASIYGIFWIIKNKIHNITFLFFLILFFAFIFINKYIIILLYICFSIALGFFANKILMRHFIRHNNCKFLGQCVGNNEKEAKKSFLDDWNNDLEKDNSELLKEKDDNIEKDNFVFKDDF